MLETSNVEIRMRPLAASADRYAASRRRSHVARLCMLIAVRPAPEAHAQPTSFGYAARERQQPRRCDARQLTPAERSAFPARSGARRRGDERPRTLKSRNSEFDDGHETSPRSAQKKRAPKPRDAAGIGANALGEPLQFTPGRSFGLA